MALEGNSCCCGLDLRKWSLFIGYLNLTWDIIITFILIAFDLLILFLEVKSTLLINALVLTILFMIHLIFNIVLLVGLHTRKRGFVYAYLIYTIIFIVAVVILNVWMIQKPSTGLIISDSVYLVINIFLLVVIRSCAVKMDGHNDVSETPVVYNAV